MTVSRWVKMVMAIVLATVLVACGSASTVPNSVLKKAIALQVTQTEQQISNQLRLASSPQVQIDRFKVSDQNQVNIQGFPSYQVKGTYDFTLKLPKQKVTQQGNPFEVYVQRQGTGKTTTWWLAQQQEIEDELDWVTQAIQ
jgi:hypothetical protein